VEKGIEVTEPLKVNTKNHESWFKIFILFFV
jgi:hypothetical protein